MNLLKKYGSSEKHYISELKEYCKVFDLDYNYVISNNVISKFNI